MHGSPFERKNAVFNVEHCGMYRIPGVQRLITAKVKMSLNFCVIVFSCLELINPYPTAFPYGNGMVLHFYQQQESSTTKTVHKVINKGLKTYV